MTQPSSIERMKVNRLEMSVRGSRKLYLKASHSHLQRFHRPTLPLYVSSVGALAAIALIISLGFLVVTVCNKLAAHALTGPTEEMQFERTLTALLTTHLNTYI